MITYQDFLQVGDREEDRMSFIRSAIKQYTSSDFYKTARIAEEYDRKQNPDIRNFSKYLYTASGRKVPDTYSSNYKVGRAFFPFFVVQEVQYLLSNGATWESGDTKDKLGTKRFEFDTQLQELAHNALVGGVSYGFWNADHIDAFTCTEFLPMPDEENGSLRAGIRWWQIDSTKPLRATLYEEDGYTDYIWDDRDEAGNVNSGGRILREKRAYKITSIRTEVDGDIIYKGENYPSFPIVPMWGNKKHQSEIVGLREQIFVYDAIKSGFCNSVEEASYVFWAIQNAPGMDDIDLATFLERVRKNHIAKTVDAGSTAEPHIIETPYQSREALLDRLEKDIYKDAMAFDPEHVASGAATATEIRAAYNPLDLKTNDFEFCVRKFINGILDLAGIEDSPTFTRDRNINTAEEIQTIMSASTALDGEYVTKKILTLLGDGDQAEEIIRRMIADEVTRTQELNDVTDYANAGGQEGGDLSGENPGSGRNRN